MREQIETTLQPLIGLPLWAVGRAVSLVWFIFGAQHTVLDFRGKSKTVGDYSLHVQCPWRVRFPARIVVASGDLYFETDGTLPDDCEFPVGPNLFDRRIDEWLRSYAGEFPTVIQVVADDIGSLSLRLSDGLTIELFPDDTVIDEHAENWRFFNPSTDEDHFVVSAALGQEEENAEDAE